MITVAIGKGKTSSTLSATSHHPARCFGRRVTTAPTNTTTPAVATDNRTTPPTDTGNKNEAAAARPWTARYATSRLPPAITTPGNGGSAPLLSLTSARPQRGQVAYTATARNMSLDSAAPPRVTFGAKQPISRSSSRDCEIGRRPESSHRNVDSTVPSAQRGSR